MGPHGGLPSRGHSRCPRGSPGSMGPLKSFKMNGDGGPGPSRGGPSHGGDSWLHRGLGSDPPPSFEGAGSSDHVVIWMGLPGGHGPLGGGSSNGMGDYLPPFHSPWGPPRVLHERGHMGPSEGLLGPGRTGDSRGVRLPLESLGVSSGDPDPRPTGPWTFMGGGWSIIRMGVPSVGGPSGPHGTGSRGPSRPLIRATWTGSSGGSGSSYGARASYPWTGTPPRGGPPSSIGSLTDPSEGEDRTRAIMGLSGPHGSSDGRSNGPPRARVEVVGPWGPGRRSSFQTGGNPSRFLLHSSLGPEGRRSDGPPQRGTEGAARRARPLWAPVTDWACLRPPGGPRLRVPRISRISRVSHHLSSLIIVPYRVSCPLSSLIISYRPPSSLIALIASPAPPLLSWIPLAPLMDPHGSSWILMPPMPP
ncbi:hypothetical protein GMRT_21623 [Giardia muris]|uniref:Uncharacterized protein n=1 Tax=Giardia muris TaxID=5742 RepID=A0A4Z1TDX9_GIAMU|nr:hypothetical protein GMRT_21623 [Giardia muris]|eukprot:TNJ30759.1 hypothetical protein GMRT_21623 [Giardia muris]